MKRHIAIKALVTFVVLLIFAGCQFGLEPENEDTAVDEFVGLFDVSYELELQGSTAVSGSLASAGVPSFSSGISGSATVDAPSGGLFVPVSGTAGGSVTDYPEPGQVTEYEVERSTTYPGHFQITATTTPMTGFEADFIADRTVETWYVLDGNTIGTWELADGGAVDPTGSSLGPLYQIGRASCRERVSFTV